MPLRLQVEALALRELLSVAYRFTLPSFQRAYVWGSEEVDRLLDEIETAIDRGADAWHYLGTIILARADGAPEASIVDGQQRITTCMIILAVLRDLQRAVAVRDELHAMIMFGETGGVNAGMVRLQPRRTLVDRLRGLVQELGATAQPAGVEEDALSASEANVLRNRDRVRARFGKLSTARRERIRLFLCDSCQLAVHTMANEEDARRIFVITQTTGIEPEANDVLKANVIEKIDDDETREACAAAWDTCEAELDPPRLRALLEHLGDRRLRRPQRLDSIAADLDTDLVDGTAAAAFVTRELVPATRAFAAFKDLDLDAGPLAGRINRRLQYLSWLEAYPDWQAVAVHWLLAPGRDPETTLRFLTGLDRIVYAQALLAVTPDERRRRYLQLMLDIDEGRVLAEDGLLELPAEARRQLAETLRQASFKGRRYTRSILQRLDGAMLGDAAVTPPIKSTIEHILPLKPSSRGGWRQVFGAWTESAYAEGKHRLANLTLLEARAASKDPGNAAFAVKRPFYAESQFALTRNLSELEVWRPEALEARADWIVTTLFRSWDIA